MQDSTFYRILKVVAVLNIIVVCIIMLDFLLVPITEQRQIEEFNAERITSRSLRSSHTTIDYYVDMADGERIYLAERSPLEDLMTENETLLVYNTPLLKRTKFIESLEYDIREKVSMLHSITSLMLVLSALIIPIIYMSRPESHNTGVLLVIASIINIYMTFMYFYRY